MPSKEVQTISEKCIQLEKKQIGLESEWGREKIRAFSIEVDNLQWEFRSQAKNLFSSEELQTLTRRISSMIKFCINRLARKTERQERDFDECFEKPDVSPTVLQQISNGDF